MKLEEIMRGQPPLVSALVSKLLNKGVHVKARVEISTVHGMDRGDAKILSVDPNGWSFKIVDLIDDDGTLAPLTTDFQLDDDEKLTLEKTSYGYLLRYKEPKRYIGV